jgi:cytochrome c-type biogenesis protein CcmH/NrfG
MWTVVDEENDIIHVRAIIHADAQQDELRKLIAALEKRLTKEPTDVRPTPDV